ncbi:MAG: RNA chaperone Hfq, partial [Chloroflexi bacterium]|nr:RNA chaperone Hfq [Chloroflexota bacterium]
ELRWRYDWPRKALSAALVAAREEGHPIRLHLRTGESFEGHVEWWDLGAVLLTLADGGQVVVQRHVVETWE